MMSASVENSLDCLMWQKAFAAKYEGRGKFEREEWDQLLGHCQVRSPYIHFALLLMLSVHI